MGANPNPPKSGAAGDGPKKSPWNSLEIARIVVGILTPLSLAALGYIVSTTTTKEERSYQEGLRKEANDRERRARLDAQAQAERLAIQTEQKEAQRLRVVREDADRARRLASYEAALDRAAAWQRELAIQDRAAAREERLRADAREQARQAIIYDRRTALWDEANNSIRDMLQAGALIEDASRAGTPPPPGTVDTYNNSLRNLESRMRPYLSFFSENFAREFNEFLLIAHAPVTAEFSPGFLLFLRRAQAHLVEQVRGELTPPESGPAPAH